MMGAGLKQPWRLVAVGLAGVCLILGYAVWVLVRSRARLSERFEATYSARVLAEVRLSLYLDLVDEKNAALAAAAAAVGDTLRAESLCLDLCSIKPPLCDSLLLAVRLRNAIVIPESRGVAAAVCAGVQAQISK